VLPIFPFAPTNKNFFFSIQKCATVQELAGELGIVLEYIPPYNPNLNLIERIWKFTKGELRSKYYGDFESFRKN